MPVLKDTALTRLIQRIKGSFVQIKDAVLSVNGVAPVNNNVTINKVALADNLDTAMSQTTSGSFIIRTTGGSASLDDGDGWLNRVRGTSIHTGYVAESLEHTVTPMPREEGETPITATLNHDTFVGAVSQSGTYTTVYTTDWSVDPATYGLTVTGTPVAGDTITIEYTKEERGTITNSNPTKLHSTGWNLYNNTVGYARVVRYSDEYGYRIDGAFTAVEFATTVTGARETISVENNGFMVPEDGFIFVTGGDSTTAVYTTWSDWMEGYEGDFMPYTVSTVDFSAVMQSYFPFGLAQVGAAQDEININLGTAISRIDRIAYSVANLATVIETGADYDYDTNWIYFVKEYEDTYAIEVDGSYTAYEYGIEYFEGTQLPVEAQMIYGVNLKNRLERDVVTISSGLANNITTTESGMALDARQGKVLGDRLGAMRTLFGTAIEIPDGADLSTYRTPGLYYVVSSTHAATIVDPPFTNAGFTMLVIKQGAASSATVQQIAFSNTNAGGFWHRYVSSVVNKWYRYYAYGGETTNITSVVYKNYTASIAAGSSRTFTVPNSCRARLDIMSANSDMQGTIYVGGSSSGGVIINTVGSLSNITPTTAKNQLTLANASSSMASVYITAYNGVITYYEEETT